MTAVTNSYETSGDGPCEYVSKAAAIRNAIKARALNVKTGKGRTVWTNPAGGETRGEVCDRWGAPLRRQPILP